MDPVNYGPVTDKRLMAIRRVMDRAGRDGMGRGCILPREGSVVLLVITGGKTQSNANVYRLARLILATAPVK